MSRKIFSVSLIALIVAVMLSACGTAKHSTRKCDGRKGTRTPMGLM
ncbi:MAG TPA: hypothetical protein VK151_02695 [Fluviicola sp.]|nr:hypothetical protein [Fluviicola sp.]